VLHNPRALLPVILNVIAEATGARGGQLVHESEEVGWVGEVGPARSALRFDLSAGATATARPPGDRGDDLNNNWPPGRRRNSDESREDEKSRDTKPGWGRATRTTSAPAHRASRRTARTRSRTEGRAGEASSRDVPARLVARNRVVNEVVESAAEPVRVSFLDCAIGSTAKDFAPKPVVGVGVACATGTAGKRLPAGTR
jgi:hypothetical protein